MNCPLFAQRTNQTRAGALQVLLSFSMLMKKSSCLSPQKKKKKSLLRKKKNNSKRRRLEGKSHMAHQRRGGKAQRAQSHPQQNLSQKQPLEILSLYYRVLKENENQQEAGMVLSSLHKSWTAPGSLFFSPPRSEEFSSDRKDDFSCVHHP